MNKKFTPDQEKILKIILSKLSDDNMSKIRHEDVMRLFSKIENNIVNIDDLTNMNDDQIFDIIIDQMRMF